METTPVYPFTSQTVMIVILLSFHLLMLTHGLKSPVSKPYLLDQAARVRRKILPLPPSPSPADHNNDDKNDIYQQYSSPQTLFYPLSYIQKNNKKRGFANWLLKDKIMIGQYPNQTPESNGPTLSCAQNHIDSLVIQSNIRLFCCLQSEIPAQDDYVSWENMNGKAYFEKEYERKNFPHFFRHYAPLVQQSYTKLKNEKRNSRMDEGGNRKDDLVPPTFLHSPIIDLSTPDTSSQLYETLSSLLETLENRPDCAIYIHCWGGRGRAGLVGACLLSLLFPQLSSSEILEWVQRGYDTRYGAEDMPFGLKQSPQTTPQREFVRKFVEEMQMDSY